MKTIAFYWIFRLFLVDCFTWAFLGGWIMGDRFQCVIIVAIGIVWCSHIFFLVAQEEGAAPVHVAPALLKHEVEIVSLFYKKEVINGHAFVHREDVVNGMSKKSLEIDGCPVDVQKYEDTILEAEKEVRRVERRQLEERRVRERAMRLESQINLSKKIVQVKIVEAEQWLTKLQDTRLKPFLVFDALTYASREEFDRVALELIPEAREVVMRTHQEISFDAIKSIGDNLEDTPQRLCDLFYASVDAAIKSCNDTKLLKELLDIVSHVK